MKEKTILKDIGNRYNRENKTILIFVEQGRPLGNGGTVIEDIVWRRDHDVPVKPSELVKGLKEILADYNLTPVKARYDRYAGCGMCPCSPGYVVTVLETYRGYKQGMWVEV